MPLAFPNDPLHPRPPTDSASNGYYTNEESEAGTPFSPSVNTVPEIVIDPALLGVTEMTEAYPPSRYQPPPINGYPADQYAMAHQFQHQQYPTAGAFVDPNVPPPGYLPYHQESNGYQPYYGSYPDPYAPPPPQEMPTDPPAPAPASPAPISSSSKSVKRVRKRRKPKRDENCSFCQGTDQNNAKGQEEPMVSCCNCGRSGHPSCVQIEHIGSVIRSYDWQCQDCKTCEVCAKKGREDHLMFCDSCDRGWHTHCLMPPLDGLPRGSWSCPKCPQPAEGSSTIRRSSSIASSSRFMVDPQRIDEPAVDEAKAVDGPLPTPPMVETPEPVKPAPAEKPKVASVKISHGRGRPKKVKGSTLPAPPSRPSNATPEPESPLVDPPPIPTSPTRSVSQKGTGPRIRLKLPKSSKKGKGKAAATADEDDGADLFDGVLQGAAADVSKTTITAEDKARFEASKTAAEARLGPPNSLQQPFTPGTSARPRQDSVDTEILNLGVRPLRSLTSQPHLHLLASASDKGKGKCPGDATLTKESETAPAAISPTLRIKSIRFGEFEIDTWYDAPFPEEYASVPDGMLWICEFCLKYMKSRFSAGRHRLKCKMRHPPGDEIYRDENISVFEVDGRKNKIYCQNLCLLSKMFLDHKSLFYDVEPFLFYVVAETDDVGARFIGYFSKEKRSPKEYNLSCIMTLPIRQKRGWGNFLIDLSYLLSKKEGRIGGPETPLSALGAITYRRYWTLTLMNYFRTDPTDVTLPGISAETSMTIEDVYSTLQANNMIISYDDPTITEDKSKQGRRGTARPPRMGLSNGNSRRHGARGGESRKGSHPSEEATIIPRRYRIYWDKATCDQYVENWERRKYLRVRPERLKWSPFLLSRVADMDLVVDREEGSPDSKDALVETMAQRAGEEARWLKEELERLDREREEREREEREREQQQTDDDEDAPSRLLKARASLPNLTAKLSRSRITPATASIIRTRSSRDLRRDSASRGSFSRGGSRSNLDDGDEEDGDALHIRASRRLRMKSNESGRLMAVMALRKRKRGDSSSDEQNEDDTPRRRSARRATASSRVTSEGEGDILEGSDDGTRTPTTRSLRARPSQVNGVNGSARPSTTTRRRSQPIQESPRKKRRVDSESAVESEVEEQPRSRGGRQSRALPDGDGDEDVPMKNRLRTKKAKSPPPRRRSNRLPIPKRRTQDSDDEYEDEGEESEGSSSAGSPRGRTFHRLDFESTGTLSSVGPEPEDEEDDDRTDGKPEVLSAPPRSADALALLASAADYVPHLNGETYMEVLPNGGAADGEDADGDADGDIDAEGEVDDDAEGEAEWDC